MTRCSATIWGMIVCVCAAAGAAAAPPASPQTTFFHANALYKDGQYAAAAREYEELLQGGLESGNLYFNLGNAYFKAGEQGRAILNYERARRLIPGDPDLEANLAYAQSATATEACPSPLWWRLVFPLAQRTGFQPMLWITSAVYSLFMLAVVTYRLWLRRPRWLRSVSAVLAVLVLLTTSSLAAQAISDSRRQAVVIQNGDTPARFEPAAAGTVHFVLKQGTLLRVIDTREGWLEVMRCDGRRGWVERAAIEEL